MPVLKCINKFAKSEDGYTAESVTWIAVLGIGSATMLFGLYIADRYQGGGVGDDLKALKTPSSLPYGTEQIIQVNAGYSGAITGITIQ